MMKRLITAISGASGSIYGIRMLQVLREVEGVETQLVLSKAARRTIPLETDFEVAEIEALADKVHNCNDIAASISSGSYPVHGMVVMPCSIKTLSGIAQCYSDNLLLRAADVTLKERRPLVLGLRETPLHHGHIRLMERATLAGAIIMPLTPAFYQRPQTIDDIVNQGVNRALDLLGIHLEEDLFQRWQGA